MKQHCWSGHHAYNIAKVNALPLPVFSTTTPLFSHILQTDILDLLETLNGSQL